VALLFMVLFNTVNIISLKLRGALSITGNINTSINIRDGRLVNLMSLIELADYYVKNVIGRQLRNGLLLIQV
jgi:hypothetical protein